MKHHTYGYFLEEDHTTGGGNEGRAGGDEWNVIGSPSAALATNQAACAIPQRAPLNKAGKRAVPCGIHGLFLLQIA